MKNILIFAAIAMSVASCSRNEDNNSLNNTPPNVLEEKRIVQINKDGMLHAKIYYGSDKKISGIDYFKNGSLNYRNKVEYENGLQKKWSWYDNTDKLTSYDLYHFDGNLVIKKERYTVTSGVHELKNYQTFENRPGKTNNLIKSTYYKADGTSNGYYTIEYTDELGSSVSNIYNENNQKTQVSVWVKDTKKAFDKYFSPFIYQHEHNNISISYRRLVPSTAPDLSYTSVFTYDGNGYPLTAKRVYTNGTVENYEYIWE